MSRKRVLSLVLAVGIIGYVGTINADDTGEMLKNENIEFPNGWYVNELNFDDIYFLSDIVTIVYQPESEQIEEMPERPNIEGIDLSDDILDYIWEVSLENNLSYELLLAFAKVESNFTETVKSNTNDSGLLQINRNTEKWIAKELGLSDYNIMDAKTNIDFSVWYINYLRDYYLNKGMSEEDAFYYIITAYNRGVSGANQYIRKHGENVKYTNKVIEYKELFEQGGVIN